VISSLRGIVSSIDPHAVVVDVHGVGLRVLVPERTRNSVAEGEEIVLHTSLIVREDDMTLCGFSLREEREVFDLLRSVNGVGPKSALGVLNELRVDAIASALALEDDSVFRAVSGIGPKTAKLIVVSLQGKLPHMGEPATRTASVNSSLLPADLTAIVQTLVGLGWSERVARQAVADVMGNVPAGEGVDVAEVIKRALQLLGPHTQREDFS
jgi:Holliday junction DNA helicase RuvA